MKITRLHIILMMIIAGLGVFCAYQYDRDQKRAAEIAAVKAKMADEQRIAERKAKENAARAADWARQTVAIAGEYWITAEKEGRDIANGQQTLKLAKDSLASNDYASAVTLSLQSIQELRSAPFLDIKYKVKSGDCLWNIAKKPEHYGKGREWVRIWKANKKQVPDFDLIHPRQILTIPKNKPAAPKTTPVS